MPLASLRAAVLATAASLLAAPVLAQNVTFVLTNISGATLVEFYVAPADSDDWEEDLLGSGVLPSGHEVDVIIADGGDSCDYHLLMVFEDGDELTDEVDICQLAGYTIE